MKKSTEENELTTGQDLPAPIRSAVAGIIARIPKGCTGVLASTQYGMGLILTEQNEIVFRDDSLSHGSRKTLAEEVNAIIKPNTEGLASPAGSEL